MVAVVVIRDIVATSCRDRGVEGGQHRETESPLAEQEGGVGGTVSGDVRWSLAWFWSQRPALLRSS